MARVGWQFAGFDWYVNPEKDSNWVFDHAVSEQVPIQATKSTLQFGGRKSARRQISGWIYGENSAIQYATMEGWRQNKTQGVLVDHLGNSRNAIMIKFEPEAVQDIKAWEEGRQTWRYQAEFISTD